MCAGKERYEVLCEGKVEKGKKKGGTMRLRRTLFQGPRDKVLEGRARHW